MLLPSPEKEKVFSFSIYLPLRQLGDQNNSIMGYIILWQIVSNRGNKQINHKSFFFVPCPLLSGSGAIQLNALADIYLTNFYLPYFAFMLPQHLCHVRNFLAIFLTSRRQNHFSELGLVPVSRRRPAEYADSHFR